MYRIFPSIAKLPNLSALIFCLPFAVIHPVYADTGDTGYEPSDEILPDLLSLAGRMAQDDCDGLDGLDTQAIRQEIDDMATDLRQAKAHELASILSTNVAMFDYFDALVDAAAAAGDTVVGGVKSEALVAATDGALRRFADAGGNAYFDGLAERLREPDVTDGELEEARAAVEQLPEIFGSTPAATLAAHRTGADGPEDMFAVLTQAIATGNTVASFEESAVALVNREILIARLDRLREDVAARTVARYRDQVFSDCVVTALARASEETSRIVVEPTSFGPWNIHGSMTIAAPSGSHSAFLTIYLHGGDIPSVDGVFNFVVPNAEFEGYDGIRRGMRTDEMGSVASTDIGDQNEIETTIRVFPRGEFGNMGEALILTLSGIAAENSADGWTLGGELFLPDTIPADWARYLGVPAEGAGGTSIGTWSVDSANRS